MRIVYLAAGAAGMYCGSCLHDNALAAALLKLGEDVLLVPTYTPLRTDAPNVSQRRVFFGGINVYLQQKFPLFRRTPWLVDRLFNAPAMIRWATRRSDSVDAAQLGDLTVSMLAGQRGHQRKELQKLVHWLRTDIRPDIVHLSNALLLGMVDGLRELGSPIVCSLSGEDIFVERLAEPHAGLARRAMQQHAEKVPAFVALNGYYADKMANELNVPRSRIHVVLHGVDIPEAAGQPVRPKAQPPVIGYLARVCPEKGLHLLVEACELLDRDAGVPPFQVRAAGYLGSADREYLHQIVLRTKRWRQPEAFHYCGELTLAEKIKFLQSLSLMSVPTTYHESKGLSLIEGLAQAVPIVVPAHGAFPELVADTGGGLLFEPGDGGSLAAQLKTLLLDPALAGQLGSRGAEAIRQRYRSDQMALETLALYRRLLGR